METGLNVVDTSDPGTLSVSMDPSRYDNLIVKSRVISPDDPDRLEVPTVDAYAEYRSDGVYGLRLPVDELMAHPEGHYLVVLDAYVNGIMPTEPPLQVRKNVYVSIGDAGMNRIGLTRFVRETRDVLVDTYSHFSDHFGGQGIGNDEGAAASNSGESECCTDPDPDLPEDPDVDVDGPGETGGEETDPPGGEDTGGGEWDPEDDPLYDIWDCWANGNCEDEDDESDTGSRDTDDTEDTGETEDSDSLPTDTGPTDSGPMW